MKELKAHFQRHGAVHAFWIISGLILCIAALLIRLPSGERVNEYISFASSLSSLLLAVVAIFYSFISNQDITHSAHSMHDSIGKLEGIINTVTTSVTTISDRAERISDDLLDIRPTVEKIHERVSVAGPASIPEENNVESVIVRDGEGVFKQTPTVGVAVALYSIAKASSLGIKNIDIEAMISDDVVWQNYTYGVFGTIESVQPCGIAISLFKVGNGDALKSYYSIDHVPNSVREEVISFVKPETYPKGKKFLDQIDAYLALEG